MNIKANDDVWTTDGTRLGVARRWHFRPEDQIDPEDRLYAAYLEIENFELGDVIYVPDVYLAGRDEATGRVMVTVPMKQVMRLTWTRMPDFVAFGQGSQAPLVDEAAAGMGEPV